MEDNGSGIDPELEEGGEEQDRARREQVEADRVQAEDFERGEQEEQWKEKMYQEFVARYDAEHGHATCRRGVARNRLDVAVVARCMHALPKLRLDNYAMWISAVGDNMLAAGLGPVFEAATAREQRPPAWEDREPEGLARAAQVARGGVRAS